MEQRQLSLSEIKELVDRPECECLNAFTFWWKCPVHGWYKEFYPDEEEMRVLEVQRPS